MRFFQEAFLLVSRRNEFRYMVGLIPELHALGVRITVLLLNLEAHPAKVHLRLGDEILAFIRQEFPFVSARFLHPGSGYFVDGRTRKTRGVFISLSSPDLLDSFSISRPFPWIQIQHADDVFELSGNSKKKADGFLLMGEKWVSDEVRFDPILSHLSRTSIDYVRSKPTSFPGHLGLNSGVLGTDLSHSSSHDFGADILLFDHAIRLRGRSAVRSFLKTALLYAQHGPELSSIRGAISNIGRRLEKEGMAVAIRPRLKGLSLPLGYPRGASRASVELVDDDTSYQIRESKGVISFYPSFAVLEALFLGRPVLGIDWWSLIGSDSGIHSSPQRVLWSELEKNACPGFRIADQNLGELSLHSFFSQADVLGDFDIHGWISPAKQRRGELDRLFYELGITR